MDNCQSSIDNNGSACGGGSGDPTTQASCTPWPFRGPKGTDNQFQEFCNGEDVGYFAASYLTGSTDSYGVWYDDSQPDNDPNKNYWVIHGCDGAGIQVGDCMGGQALVEQIGPYSSTYADASTGAWNGKAVPLNNEYSDDNMNDHISTVFEHPGTNKVYDWMWAGMWTNGEGTWPDKIKPWWNVWQKQGVADIADLGPDKSIFFSVYPWVCNLGSQDLAWYWDAGGAGKAMDPIYGTDCASGGACNDYAKCYYDNEPYSNNHWDSNSVPPIARFYKFVNNGDDTITGWMMYEKTYEGGNQIFDYTNNNCMNGCDDSCKANNKDSTGAPVCFNLKRLSAIPW